MTELENPPLVPALSGFGLNRFAERPPPKLPVVADSVIDPKNRPVPRVPGRILPEPAKDFIQPGAERRPTDRRKELEHEHELMVQGCRLDGPVAPFAAAMVLPSSAWPAVHRRLSAAQGVEKVRLLDCRVSLSQEAYEFPPAMPPDKKAAALSWVLLIVFSVFLRLIEKLEDRSEEHTSELQSLMRISYAVFCLKKKNSLISQKNIQNITQ